MLDVHWKDKVYWRKAFKFGQKLLIWIAEQKNQSAFATFNHQHPQMASENKNIKCKTIIGFNTVVLLLFVHVVMLSDILHVNILLSTTMQYK